MKKYPIFFFLALIILIAGICTPEVMYASLPKVEYIKAEKSTVNKTVTVSGKIVAKQESIQTADYGYYIGEIMVTSGEEIKKGDRILKVDTEKTEKIYAANGQKYTGELYITSEYSGTINSVFITKDTPVTENTQLISVINIEKLCASLFIGEDVFSQIKSGQKITLSGSALSKDYSGKITQIGAVATQNTTSAAFVEAIAEINEPDSDLKPGFNIKAKIVTKKLKDVIIVPSNCISQDENGEFVYKLNENKAEKTYIKSGDISSKGTIIKQGINEGEYLIANPESIEKDGSYVRNEE